MNLVPGGRGGGGHRRLAEATVGSVFSHGIWEQRGQDRPPRQRLGRRASSPGAEDGGAEARRDQSGRQVS